MNRSGKYELMRQEYVLGDDTVTYASLGEKYGRSPGSIGPIAKKEGWIELRAAHRASVAAKADLELTGETIRKIIDLRTKTIDAAITSVNRYVEAVDNKEITPNATDVAKLVTTVRELTTKVATGGEEDDGDGIHISGGATRDLARALEAVVRSRADTGGMAEPARPQLVGSSG
jgi:hypothetical protein